MLGAANRLGLPRTHAGWQKPRWPYARRAYATSATPSFRPLALLTTISSRWRPWKSHSGRTQWFHRPCGAMLLYPRCASHNGHMDIIAHHCILDTSIESSVTANRGMFSRAALEQCTSATTKTISQTASGVRRSSALRDVGLFRRTGYPGPGSDPHRILRSAIREGLADDRGCSGAAADVR